MQLLWKAQQTFCITAMLCQKIDDNMLTPALPKQCGRNGIIGIMRGQKWLHVQFLNFNIKTFDSFMCFGGQELEHQE